MDKANLLVVAMAEQCQRLILESEAVDDGLPKALQPKHLLWMCRMITEHAEDSPPTKLHRWIGFIQCAMMAHRMLDFEEAKAMFNAAKTAYGGTGEDLLDHLDPSNSFELDIGGQG
jgi:hypothetical protein